MKTSIGGFGLIEILISLVVLSVGLLGIAKLQILGLRQTHHAYLSSVAQSQLNTMAERIHASCFDVAQWNQINATLLPQGEGRLSSSNDHYKINLRWTEPAKKQEMLSLDVYVP